MLIPDVGTVVRCHLAENANLNVVLATNDMPSLQATTGVRSLAINLISVPAPIGASMAADWNGGGNRSGTAGVTIGALGSRSGRCAPALKGQVATGFTVVARDTLNRKKEFTRGDATDSQSGESNIHAPE